MLPLSFDYGFSQLTTAFHVGASVVLMDYLLPRDVLKLVVTERITGLAAVPPVWIQLAELPWPDDGDAITALLHELRRGHATATLAKLRAALAEDQAVPDVWPDRGVPRHVSASGGSRSPPGLHGQGDPNAEIMVVRRTAVLVPRVSRANSSIAAH